MARMSNWYPISKFGWWYDLIQCFRASFGSQRSCLESITVNLIGLFFSTTSDRMRSATPTHRLKGIRYIYLYTLCETVVYSLIYTEARGKVWLVVSVTTFNLYIALSNIGSPFTNERTCDSKVAFQSLCIKLSRQSTLYGNNEHISFTGQKNTRMNNNECLVLDSKVQNMNKPIF